MAAKVRAQIENQPEYHTNYQSKRNDFIKFETHSYNSCTFQSMQMKNRPTEAHSKKETPKRIHSCSHLFGIRSAIASVKLQNEKTSV